VEADPNQSLLEMMQLLVAPEDHANAAAEADAVDAEAKPSARVLPGTTNLSQ
jgi:hypothetical protein